MERGKELEVGIEYDDFLQELNLKSIDVPPYAKLIELSLKKAIRQNKNIFEEIDKIAEKYGFRKIDTTQNALECFFISQGLEKNGKETYIFNPKKYIPGIEDEKMILYCREKNDLGDISCS